ncbi:MAG: B12-binding domain-containing radical SAM protein [Firmicutes bacterium]|nr:B12-binding domain-containing radical SAM protein [Bacillota bacterium]
MKVLLIDPPFKRFTGFTNFYFPVGLGYLAAVLRQRGHKVRIFDVDAAQKGSDIDFSDEYLRLELYVKGLQEAGHPVWAEIARVLEQYRPDVVGITAITTKFGSVLKTAQVCKEALPDAFIVVGGPHATANPGQAIAIPQIDYVVRGEGEKIFPELLSVLQEGKDPASVRGLTFQKDGQVIHTGQPNPIEDLDTVPFPARDLLMNPQNYTSEDMGVIMSSRGCPFGCTYCFHMFDRRVRYRSVDNVIAELRHVRDVYGTRQFAFKDDSFTVNRERVAALCEAIIREDLQINWDCTTRANLLDDALLELMVKAGCNSIKIGVETGSERILRETSKGVSLDDIRRAARLLNRQGVFWSAYFMIGLPTETEEDILATHRFMKELNPYYCGLGVYNPFPNTPLFAQGVEMGLLQPDVQPEHFYTTNPKDYFFVDPARRVRNLEPARFAELARFMMSAFHKHNTRLRNVFRRAWARRKAYTREPRLLWSDGRKALRWLARI